MWIQDQIGRTDAPQLPFLGTVTALHNGLADISAHTRLANAPCVSPFGIASLPRAGDTVLVLPVMDGYVCLGMLSAPAAGELEIRNPAGAVIRLCTDGSIRLNDTLIPPSAGSAS